MTGTDIQIELAEAFDECLLKMTGIPDKATEGFVVFRLPDGRLAEGQVIITTIQDEFQGMGALAR